MNFQKLFKIFIILYTLSLMYLMLFGFGRTADDFKQIQLVPFRTIADFIFFQHGFYQFFINVFSNVFLFIPFGLLGILNPKFLVLKWNLIFFWIGLFCMEFLQYITGRGTADVDDFILNSLGLIIGHFLLKSKYSQFVLAKLERM